MRFGSFDDEIREPGWVVGSNGGPKLGRVDDDLAPCSINRHKIKDTVLLPLERIGVGKVS